jgi:hypothetical protein
VVRSASSLRDSAVHRKQCEAAGSRALLKFVEERCPDDLFTELTGALDRVLRRRWLQVIAFAVALLHSWRRDRLASIARRLARTSLATQTLNEPSTGRDTRPSRCGLFGSPRPYQGSALRSDPMRGSRP